MSLQTSQSNKTIDMETTDYKPHIAMLPGPGCGHTIPVLELAKRLVTLHGFQVSICIVSTGESLPAQSRIIESAKTFSKFLNIVHLPQSDFTTIPPEASIFSRMCAVMRLSKPTLKLALSSFEARPVALITDQFGAECLEVARELGIPKYIYMPVSAWMVAFTVFSPILDKDITGQFTDQTEPIQIPGCRSLHQEEFHSVLKDRTTDQYEDFVTMAVASWSADGFLVNTWEGLQSSTLAALRDGGLLGKLTNEVPIYDVGPIIARPTGSKDHELFGWLENQPVGSVLYVCFGSVGSLSLEQTHEIAHGLELSKQRFLWVARPPFVTTKDDASFNDPSSYLPNGFLDRTRDVGLVIPQWAPQVEILSHPSIGGFWSHCGWNSCLEAISNGLPLIVWPLFAEQMMNAGLLVEEFGVAVRPKVLPLMEGLVAREEIADMVRKLMVDGDQIKTRVKKLKKSAHEALMEGVGTSSLALSRFANEIRKKSES